MMNRRFLLATALSVLSVVAASAAPAQETASGHVIVTANAKGGASVNIPQLSVTVSVDRKLQQVTGFVPLRGPEYPLQLAILLDNASRASMSLQLNDIRDFILSQSPSTEVAVGYMLNGMANLLQPFTTDHASVAKSLRLPMGINSINGSPYFCIQDLVKRWGPPQPGVRREVLMVTDGIDRYYGPHYNPDDPYVQAATNDAQKAGVVIYSIYYTGVGRMARRGFSDFGGQNYLIQISSDTGGESYWIGFGNPVSFAPFLKDLRVKLDNQYGLAFTAPPRKGLQPIKVKTSQPGVKLNAPSLVLLTNVPVQ